MTKKPRTDKEAMDIKTPTEPVAPPTGPGAEPPAGGYKTGNAPPRSRKGVSEVPSDEDLKSAARMLKPETNRQYGK